MSAATLAPMATAPAVPPRIADAADLSMISLKESLGASSSAAAAAELLILVDRICIVTNQFDIWKLERHAMWGTAVLKKDEQELSIGNAIEER